MSRCIKVFAPSTVANVGPGFDILGFALENIGDEIEMKRSDKPGIVISNPGSDLPTDPTKNVAGVAVLAMLKKLKLNIGLEIIIHKNVFPGSGLGSSASSAAGAVFAANELLDTPFSKYELIKFAMAGEEASSGKAHADNVAPALLGGFTLIRSYDPLDVVHIKYPDELLVVVVHPQIEVKTSDSKRILKQDLSLQTAIKQWGNVAGLVAGLASSDFNLIGRSLQDVIVEPVRSMLIPGFDLLKNIALEKGALGCSISGSGPSVFALCNDPEKAEKIAEAFRNVYLKLDITSNIYISKINKEGTKIVNNT